jgi:long-chain acyl-CoA synthetase
VEEVLRGHPGVAAAAVVGAPHPHTGETVRAWVVPAPGHHLDPAEVIAFVGDRLARFKCPTEVEVVAEIPQGLGGKVLRRALRAG